MRSRSTNFMLRLQHELVLPHARLNVRSCRPASRSTSIRRGEFEPISFHDDKAFAPQELLRLAEVAFKYPNPNGIPEGTQLSHASIL